MTGSTSSRITSLGRISGRNVRIVPNRWNWTVTTAVPPGIDELCGTGNGNRPPTRNRAGCPSSATRLGSARILARALVRRASMNSEKWPASKMPKSGELPAGRGHRPLHRRSPGPEPHEAARPGRLAMYGRVRRREHRRVIAGRRADDRFPPSVEPAHADVAGRGPIDLGDLDVEQDLARPGTVTRLMMTQPATRLPPPIPPPPPPMPPPPMPPPPTAHAATAAHAAAATAAHAAAAAAAMPPPRCSSISVMVTSWRMSDIVFESGDLAIQDDLRPDLADLDLGPGERLANPRLEVLGVERDPDQERDRTVGLIPDGQAGRAERSSRRGSRAGSPADR